MNKLNEKGLSNVMVAIAIAIIAFAVALYYVSKDYAFSDFVSRARQEEEATRFETIPEDEMTPEEIGNDTVNELDMMINDVEKASSVEEELNEDVKGYNTAY